MIFTVRGVPDWLRAKHLFLLAVLLSCASQVASGQGAEQTPQQTNDKIEQLATLARARPADSPIGRWVMRRFVGFDLPELGRDVRVGDAGDISYPLIPGRITAAGLTPIALEEKIEQ